jgi:hypothetical protein
LGPVSDEIPVYGDDEGPSALPIGVREVVDLVWELAVLGIVVGLLAGASSNYLKLLLVPLALPAWVLLKRLFDMLRRIFSA